MSDQTPNTHAPESAEMAAFRLSDFHYDLPESLIAQSPLDNRSDSRLLVLDQANVQHRKVSELPQLLRTGDHLVFNNTRVVPARLMGQKISGGKLEMMLERVTDNGRVLAKIRCSKSPQAGSTILLHSSSGDDVESSATVKSIEARVIGRHDDLFELATMENSPQSLPEFIEQYAQIPLPPYIDRAPDEQDQERYQTVFAKVPGAVAAPTAGLHFDDALLQSLNAAGISHSFITLHVGAGTFQPVRVTDPKEHVMHAERLSVCNDTVDAIRAARERGGRVIAVGTTSVRALEAAAADSGYVQPFYGETRLFLTPGVSFNVADGIFTNFHLPESTLLMLVAAYAGLDNVLAAYRVAVAEHYRFFSYGDAMLVWPAAGVRA